MVKTNVEKQSLSITEHFKEVADAMKDKIALIEKDRKITYEELNTLSENLAKNIIDLDIEPGTMIGISNQKSIELIVGILAVIKSGCCYVPLDKEYPLKRLEYMISNTDMKYFISVDKDNGIFLDTGLQSISCNLDKLRENQCPLPIITDKNSIACVLYTSGTTGNPKGVLIEQSSVINLVKNKHLIEVTEDNILAQFSNPCFDAATFEIWGGLLNGASLYILSDKYTSFRDWKDAIRTAKIDIAFFTTGLFNAIVDEDPYTFKGLRKLLIGGEMLSNSHTRKLKKEIKDISLINVYGPTECTTFTTTYEITHEDYEVIPIGKPIQNVNVGVFTEENIEVNEGDVGEICISGQGLMREYLGKPELNKSVFFQDELTQTRWYKTGDYGARLNDGNILFKGRKDNQVKIRGFRIELNEIQEKLNICKEIDNSVVTVKNLNNDNYIVVYYKCNSKSNKQMEHSLREYLSDELPNYMIPHYFVRIDEFPLNQNGKVDKQKLLDIDFMNSQEESFHNIKYYETKKKVLSIWRNVLGNQNLGIDDDFFENGGHSILATKLTYLLNEKVLPEATLQMLMENTTVNKLVDAVESLTLGNIEQILRSDSTLDEQLREQIVEVSDKPTINKKGILLTGGTGYLGAHLLYKLLLEVKDTKIYCLVRFPSKNRIQDTLVRYDLWQESFKDKLEIIEGDLGRVNFGFDDSTYETLCKEISSIYHVGAETNFLEPYSKARIANVEGIIEILKFASTNQKKDIYYTSTLSVLTGDKSWKEDDELTYSSDLMIGYSQSKWVAEKLLIEARNNGLNIDVYRLGRISSNSVNGIWNPKDMLYKVFESFITQRVLPFKDEIQFELMPVDFVTEFIYKTSREKRKSDFGIFHLYNNQTVSSELIVSYFKKHEIPYENANLHEWLEFLKNKTLSNEFHSLSALSQLIEESTKLKETKILQVETKKELKRLSMSIPKIDLGYVEGFMKHMVKQSTYNAL